MRSDGTYTNTSNSASFGSADLATLADRVLPPPPDPPVYAFEGSLDAFLTAFQAAGGRIGLRGPIAFAPLDGLDLIEEDGWVYVGTTRQLRAARDRWGSLGLAKWFGELAAEAKARREAAEVSRRVREDPDVAPGAAD
jgi:hypothetical protein